MITLCKFLDMIGNTNFLVSVDGLWDELPFKEYPKEKKRDYWDKWKDKRVMYFSILITNYTPELLITVA